jgi:hypothetical protein
MVVWTAMLAIGAFSILAWPFAAIPAWHRWLFMLGFPALVFATHGVLKMDRRVPFAFLAVLFAVASSFVAHPPSYAIPFYTNPLTISYVQTSVLQNTVPVGDSSDVVAALEWLKLTSRSGIPSSWPTYHSRNGQKYFRKFLAYTHSCIRLAGRGDKFRRRFSAYGHVALLYLSAEHEWFDPALLPSNMIEIHTNGRIAIYARAK